MNSMRNFFNQPFQMPGPIGNIISWFQQFKQFAQNPVAAIMSMRNVKVPQNFAGSPEELAKYLMSTGQMSQEQFQQFAQTANQLQGNMPKF